VKRRAIRVLSEQRATASAWNGHPARRRRPRSGPSLDLAAMHGVVHQEEQQTFWANGAGCPATLAGPLHLELDSGGGPLHHHGRRPLARCMRTPPSGPAPGADRARRSAGGPAAKATVTSRWCMVSPITVIALKGARHARPTMACQLAAGTPAHRKLG